MTAVFIVDVIVETARRAQTDKTTWSGYVSARIEPYSHTGVDHSFIVTLHKSPGQRDSLA